jgi:hypothetical protein
MGNNIEKDRWHLFQEIVRSEIRVQRNKCNSAIKREYMGE